MIYKLGEINLKSSEFDEDPFSEGVMKLRFSGKTGWLSVFHSQVPQVTPSIHLRL